MEGLVEKLFLTEKLYENGNILQILQFLAEHNNSVEENITIILCATNSKRAE